MPYGTSAIDPGTSPTTSVAVDAIAGAQYQRVKLANPNADQTGAYGIDTDPMRVRQRRRGTSDYDSGNVSVAAGAPVAVTSATVYLMGGYVVNLTDAVQRVTVTDTAGDEILSSYPLQARETKQLPVNDELALVGLKVGADSASAVKARFWGVQ